MLDDADKRLQRTSVTAVGIGRKDSSITKANAPFRACMIIITLCSVAGVFNMILLYFITDKWLWLFVVSIACAIIFSTNAGINMAIMMSVPQMHRSSAIAISSLTIHLFGDVPSPIIGSNAHPNIYRSSTLIFLSPSFYQLALSRTAWLRIV